MIKTAEVMELILTVNEIFYSLQGEGVRSGTPTIFVRLQGCSAKHACYASGVRCDTEFESGRDYALPELLQEIKKYSSSCKEITWTGGEPTDQLTPEVVEYFKREGYFQAIETSGLNPVPAGLDFICISPKVAEHVIAKNFKGIVIDELRYVRHKGQSLPSPSIQAKHYWISPHFNGNAIDTDNVRHCIELCLQNPIWKISIQNHKLWGIL